MAEESAASFGDIFLPCVKGDGVSRLSRDLSNFQKHSNAFAT